MYYLDVSHQETLRGRPGKPIAGHVTAEEVASWYRPRDVLGARGEQVLGEELAEEQMLECILADLARHG